MTLTTRRRLEIAGRVIEESIEVVDLPDETPKPEIAELLGSAMDALRSKEVTA